MDMELIRKGQFIAWESMMIKIASLQAETVGKVYVLISFDRENKRIR